MLCRGWVPALRGGMIPFYDGAAIDGPLSDGSDVVTMILPPNIHASSENSNPVFEPRRERDWRMTSCIYPLFSLIYRRRTPGDISHLTSTIANPALFV